MKFFTDNPTEFIKVVKAVKRACAKEEPRIVLTGIEMVAKDGKVTITALNGFLLIQKHIEATVLKNGSCCINPDRLISAIDKNANRVEISLKKDFVHIKSDESTASFKVLEGAYIKHAEITGKELEQPCTVYVNPRFMRKVLEAFCDYENSYVKLTVDSGNRNNPLHIQGKDEGRGMVLPIRVSFCEELKPDPLTGECL